MKIVNVEFIGGSDKLETLPIVNLPEIAFAGRSNVGKSSLINSVVNRKNLAHTSSNPGKTREINLFGVEERWVLVDMPGYGYAAVSKKEKAKWAELTKGYFLKREKLRMVCILIDSRHDPMESDLGMVEWLENNNLKYLVILTKCDKINATAVAERKQQLEECLAMCKNVVEVLPFSSVSGLGRNELIAIIKKNLVTVENDKSN